jgi:hypothetical protein
LIAAAERRKSRLFSSTRHSPLKGKKWGKKERDGRGMIASGGFCPTAETTSVILEKWSALSNHPKVKKISHFSSLIQPCVCVSTIEYRTSEEKEKAIRDTCGLYWKRYWILLLSARNQFALPATDPFPPDIYNRRIVCAAQRRKQENLVFVVLWMHIDFGMR